MSGFSFANSMCTYNNDLGHFRILLIISRVFGVYPGALLPRLGLRRGIVTAFGSPENPP